LKWSCILRAVTGGVGAKGLIKNKIFSKNQLFQIFMVKTGFSCLSEYVGAVLLQMVHNILN